MYFNKHPEEKLESCLLRTLYELSLKQMCRTREEKWKESSYTEFIEGIVTAMGRMGLNILVYVCSAQVYTKKSF